MNQPTFLHLEPTPLSQEMLDSFPHFGTVLRITANKSFYDEFQNLQNAGRWTKLVNVSCNVESGIWTGKMDKNLFKSRVFIFPDEDGVKYQKRAYVQRTECVVEQTPLTSFPQSAYFTVIEDDSLPYRTLMDSIKNPQMEHVFKCIVRVVASCPWRGESLRTPSGSDGSSVYRVRLTLEDPTARIHAYIINKEGVKFFGDNLSTAQLSTKMMKLLGIKELSDVMKPRNPPWIWCCLSSYFIDPHADDEGGRRGYMVINTKLTD